MKAAYSMKLSDNAKRIPSLPQTFALTANVASETRSPNHSFYSESNIK